MMKRTTYLSLTLLALATVFTGCKDQGEKSNGALSSNAAERVYVEPGKYDEFYAFLSGGFSGQLAVYGIPSGRLLKVVPVFSQDPEKAYGYNEETKPMLNTTFYPLGRHASPRYVTDQRGARRSVDIYERQQHPTGGTGRPYHLRDGRDHGNSQ